MWLRDGLRGVREPEAQTRHGEELREGLQNDHVLEPFLNERRRRDERLVFDELGVGFVDEEHRVGGFRADPVVQNLAVDDRARRVVRVHEVDDRRTLVVRDRGLHAFDVDRPVGAHLHLRDGDPVSDRAHLTVAVREFGDDELDVFRLVGFDRGTDRFRGALREGDLFGLPADEGGAGGAELLDCGEGVAVAARGGFGDRLTGLRGETERVLVEAGEDRVLRGGRRRSGRRGGENVGGGGGGGGRRERDGQRLQ